MTGEVSSVWPAAPESATEAELGALSEEAVLLAQLPTRPDTTAEDQPEGKAGAVTPSNVSVNVVTVITAPRRIVKLTVPMLTSPSWSWKLAVMIPPQLPLAVKVNGRVTAPPPTISAP